MSPGLIVLLLSLLLGMQPLTTDMYLPALPALTQGFGATLSQAQLTLTALLLAFGCSQLIWGPLSDRFGRRPILLWGLGAYVLSGAFLGGAVVLTLLVTRRAPSWRRLPALLSWGAFGIIVLAILSDLV